MNRYNPQALSAATPINMPVIRATTTAAEAMPCWADGTTRRVADDSGPITSPNPKPATTRSVCIAGTVNNPRMLCRSANRSTGQWEISQ
ncbi:Uncharacterised protein [Mycobacterium tuberculosis]|uniref:Uncharacterized protein n=2 Tax=Mycobacterium tuberculosis TaxID=1773 RepID=A0A655FQY6_MYCTX|nr:Uncharacterised protein [Mycobacterium tuberculosis]CKU84611.1 Uncharacterised protein [Mycobacterium tuberculosis]CNW02562.1 Uncharacterised protein [Mycobacterium tuberculosis]